MIGNEEQKAAFKALTGTTTINQVDNHLGDYLLQAIKYTAQNLMSDLWVGYLESNRPDLVEKIKAHLTAKIPELADQAVNDFLENAEYMVPRSDVW